MNFGCEGILVSNPSIFLDGHVLMYTKPRHCAEHRSGVKLDQKVGSAGAHRSIEKLKDPSLVKPQVHNYLM